MIDHIEVISAFQEHTRKYDDTVSGVERKIIHTFRVAKLSERIARGLEMDRDDVDMAWFIGILHDVGRFEQERRYHTFVDRDSVDHAELGADILFRDGLIDRFPTGTLETVYPSWRTLCETAVRGHNKLTLPSDLDERTRTFCRIIRDADKADIFRVLVTTTFAERMGASTGKYTNAPQASPEVMEYVYRHQCVPRKLIQSIFDSHIGNCCMAFELDYAVTREIVKEDGFLRELVNGTRRGEAEAWNDLQKAQMQIAREELEKAWGMEL